MGVSPQQRRERQQRDDGDPDATVHIMVCTRDSADVYHESGCKYVQQAGGTRTATRAAAQARDLVPCKDCILDERKDADFGETCPLCGDEVRNLGRHLATTCPATGGDS